MDDLEREHREDGEKDSQDLANKGPWAKFTQLPIL